MARTMTVPRQSQGEGNGEGDDSTKTELRLGAWRGQRQYQERDKVRGMVRAMTVPRQSRGEGQLVLFCFFRNTWPLQQVEFQTRNRRHCNACILADYCRFKSLLGQRVSNSTGSSRIRGSKTSFAVVHMSLLTVTGWNLFQDSISPTVPGALESEDRKQALLLCTCPHLVFLSSGQIGCRKSGVHPELPD
jgi:hypothetical protein